MSATTTVSVEAKAKSANAAGAQPDGVERRRRRRAKISAQVHVRATNAPEPFEEVCMSVDVSRDGLLFTTSKRGYWQGQTLSVTFPFSNSASAINQGQPADVMRVSESNGKFAVAVQFQSAATQAKNF